MMHRFKIFLLLVSLSACTAQDSRYKDTAMLERPPVINAVKVDEVKIKDTSLVKAEIDGTGLGTLVILKTTTPPVMVIKQPYDVAWQTLGNALKADNLEITDREHDKGKYFVSYDPDRIPEEDSSFINRTLSYFDDNSNEERYILTVKEQGTETEVTVANNTEPKQSSKKDEEGKVTAQPPGGADRLLESIYKTMSETKHLRRKGNPYDHRDQPK